MINIESLLRRLALVELERDEYRARLRQICRSPKSAKRIAHDAIETYGSMAREIENVLSRAEAIRAEEDKP